MRRSECKSHVSSRRAVRLLWGDGLGRIDAARLRGGRMKRDLIFLLCSYAIEIHTPTNPYTDSTAWDCLGWVWDSGGRSAPPQCRSAAVTALHGALFGTGGGGREPGERDEGGQAAPQAEVAPRKVIRILVYSVIHDSG